MRCFSDARSGAGAPFRDRLLLTASMFLCVSVMGFMEPFVPLFLEQSGLRRTEIGLVSGIGAGLALFIQPYLGRLSDRLDARRPLMLASAIAAGLAYLSYRWTDHLLGFILLSAIGLNGVMYLNTANAVVVGRIARQGGDGGQCASRFAAYRIWGSVGYVVVSLLSGWLLSRLLAGGTELTRATLLPLFSYVPVLFTLIGLVVCFMPDPCRGTVRTVEPSQSLPQEASPHQRRMCERNMKRFLHAYFLYLFAYTGSAAYLSLYLKHLGATPMWLTGVFAAGVVCEVIVMSQVGRLSDHFGRRPLLALSFILMPVRLLLYMPATSPLWVMAVQTMHGLNFGVMVAVSVAFISDLCDEANRGRMQARMAATSGLASALGPAAGGWIAEHIGIRYTFGLMAGVAAVGAVIFLWRVRESHPSPVRLYRVGPARLLPVFQVMCLPLGRLSRRWAARLSARR